MGKKGSTKNKLARMSEEERARYLQHRADMEEEARRRKQQLIALYMKNKLKREDAFCRLNLAKINQEWRFILRQVKCQELKKEIMEVERLFRESLEQKSRIMHRLLKDLDEAEELYSTLQQSHMGNIENLIEIQSKRMQFWREKYLNDKSVILAEAQEDFNKYGLDRKINQVQLESVYYCLDAKRKAQSSDAHEYHLNKMDEIRSQMTIDLEQITRVREERIESLWNDYQDVLDEYVNYTDSFLAEYSNLRDRDEINTKLIRAHCYEIAKATDEIAGLTLQSDTLEEERDFQISYLEKYWKLLNEQYIALKKDLENVLRFDDEQFKFMTVKSHGVVESFEKLYKQGVLLLQLASACRRLESEKEKVLVPFSNQCKTQMFERSLSVLKCPPSELKDNIADLWFSLENFWIRVNNAQLDCVARQEEKTSLEKENAQLKESIREYLTKMALTTGNVVKAQERLKQRPKSMKVEKIPQIELVTPKRGFKNKFPKRPVTCIEGNLTNAIRSAKLVEGKLKTVQIRAILNW